MPDYELYTVAVTEQAITESGQGNQRQVSSEGSLNGAQAATTPLPVEAGTKNLTVRYKGYNSEMIAQMVGELAANSGGLEVVPFAGIGEETADDGYYSLESEDNSRVDPRFSELPQFRGTMRYIGSHKDIWRSISTKRVQIENDYGNNGNAYIGLPATAVKTKWYDGENAVERASPVETVTAEHGDIDRYDIEASSFSDPTLLYEVPYSSEGPVDPKVWDTRGNDSRFSTVPEGEVLEWQKVFNTSHEFSGAVVLSNGVTRLTIDEDARTMAAEAFDGDSWGALPLGDTTAANEWVPYDVDIYFIGATRVTGQIEFLNTADDSLFNLRFHLTRGYDKPQWYIPAPEVDSEGPTPTGLQEKLDPVADPNIKATGAETGHKTRSEVRS